ncbi:PKD-like family lipoprotein [Butyricimonas hominis]|uniref:PKD-like family lipoprotein n=1 Tax=Butyricimonas TaxID=574697 RepID=UPI0035116F03
MKMNRIILFLFAFSLCACFDDKGNYEYHEVAEITIENIPEVVEVLGNSDHIVVKPKIVSSLEGEIGADNTNFEFGYRIEKKSGGVMVSGQRWVDLNPSKTLELDTLAAFVADTYIGWFTVTDKRSGIQASATFDIKVSSPTYEGWMVLCDEGEEERVRMDMISVISAERIIPAYDLLAPLGLPDLKHARGIGFYPNLFASPNDVIYVMTGEGTYKLDRETFKTDVSWDINNIDFIIPPADERVVCYTSVNNSSTAGALACFCVTDAGNAYAQVLGSAGAAFEYPVNTSERGKAPEYRVAPYVGVSMARPGNASTALLYDTDNRRFVGWKYNYSDDDAMQTLTPLPDPESGLFSFKTGMELVHMESTRYSNGLVYAVLQDGGGRRRVYGINMSGNGFVQEVKYENMDAPDFDKATAFAFHSQFPYMFYAVGNKVYLHNLGTSTTYPMSTIALGDREVVTMLKFNLYRQCSLGQLNNQSEEFMARQYELMVASYNTDAPDNNGGKLGFYPVDGVNNTVTKRVEYDGFARIKDVVYRERR